MKIFLAALFCLNIISCGNRQVKKDMAPRSIHDSSTRGTRALIEAENRKLYDSIQAVTDRLCGLQNIANSKETIFRYQYVVFYGQISFVCEVSDLKDSTFQLTSKCILPNNAQTIIGRDLKAHEDIVETPEGQKYVHTSTQTFSQKERDTFTQIINGSYYWTWKNPMPNDGIVDGDFLELVSKSRWPRHYTDSWEPDSLRFHRNSVHCPFKGNFTDGYHFLCKKSKLLQRCGQWANVNERF